MPDSIASLKRRNSSLENIIPQSIIDKYKVAYIDAMSIAKSVLGVPIVNTTMLGALIKATRVVDIASLETPLNIRFGKLAEKNFNAMKKAFEETIILEK